MANRWLSQVAREDYVCPRCNAGLGDFCRTPSGRECNGIGGVHAERIALVPKAIAIAECSGTSVDINTMIARMMEKK